MTNLVQLPSDLPIPKDDGACAHLLGKQLPNVTLSSTQSKQVNLANMSGWLVIYCYPMTGKPGVALPIGWDEIPGARGCTPQSCAFRDSFLALTQLKAQVFGLSTQTTTYQQEAATRLHLPYALLSDEKLAFTHALELPTFEIDNKQLIKRLTIIAKNGTIQHVFYPVFPPDKNAEDVINWLKQHA